jgi:2-phosphosulfolactate phosphatase
MKIEVLEFTEGAKKAKGLAVIIDVFRAFSVECYAYDCGASKIIATGSVDEAFSLGRKYHNSILVGERDEKKVEGFHFGNSPTEIIKADLKDRIVIHTTTAGTCGLVSARDAEQVITGSFVNASAVARYIKSRNPDVVSLVAMGYRASIQAAEDLLCAEYIKSLLEERIEDFTERISDLRHTSGKRFFLPENIGFSPPTDFFLCTMPDRFDFILRGITRYDGNIDMEKISI